MLVHILIGGLDCRVLNFTLVLLLVVKRGLGQVGGMLRVHRAREALVVLGSGELIRLLVGVCEVLLLDISCKG